MTGEPRTVKPAELLAQAQSRAATGELARKILAHTDPPGTPDAKLRLGYIAAFDATTWTVTALIGDQVTQVPGIPVLAGVVPVVECAGQFLQSGDEYTLIGVLPKGPGNIRIRKPADQGITNSATLISDTHMQFQGKAGRTYLFEVLALVTPNVSSDMDFRLGWNLPSGATWSGGGPGPISTMATGSSAAVSASTNWRGFAAIAPGTAIEFGVEATSGRVTAVQLHGSIKMGGNDGLCSVAWSQLTALTATTTVKEGSYLKVDMTSEYTL